jgi:TetR/AcrR family transcriptional repressor of bet genes
MAVTASVRRNPVDKHDARRRELAESALRTLGELGYAKTSLREMANNSEFTHGVVHYYFADKLDLIVYGVQQYKAICITRYDDVISESVSAAGLLDAFADKLCETILDEAPMHRLWYDLRSQSMFETRLTDAVSHIDATLADMIWRVVTRYAELAEAELVVDKLDAYGLLDGIFQQALLGQQRDASGASLHRLAQQVHRLLPLMITNS